MHLANPESITISAVVPGGLGYANEAIIFNKESTYEIALSTEVRAAGGGAPVGTLIGAFAAGPCWRWWGADGVAPVGEWTHVIGGVDGVDEFHYVNGMLDGTDPCVG